MSTLKKRKDFVEEVNEGRIKIMANIEAMQKWRDEEENQDKDLTANDDYRDMLGVDTTLVKRIQLSTGGPGDGFKLYFSRYDACGKSMYELSHGVYYREDWGEYKESSLSDEETQTVFDFYLGGYIEEMAG